jgi:ParB-like chromosome segregation protein Spo0J
MTDRNTVLVSTISVDPEFEKLIPPLTEAEFDQLETALLEDGMREPLVVWQSDSSENGTYLLLDGHHRFRICQKYRLFRDLDETRPDGTPERPLASVVIADLPDREAALLWVEQNQLARRNLSDDQRAMMAASVLERRAKISRGQATAKARDAATKARERPRDRGSEAMGKAIAEGSELDAPIHAFAVVIDPPVEAETAPTEKLRVRVLVAKEAKVSEKKLRAARELKMKNPEAAEEVRRGEKTLRQARRETKPVLVRASQSLHHLGICMPGFRETVKRLYRTLSPEERQRTIHRVCLEEISLRHLCKVCAGHLKDIENSTKSAMAAKKSRKK